MKRRSTGFLALAGVLLTITGCMTPYGEQRNIDMRRRAEMVNMKTDIERLQARLDGMTTAQEDIFRKLEALQTSADRAGRDQEERISAIAAEVKATATAREELKKEIVDGLSRKIAEMMKAQRPRVSPSRQGYEHVVEPGQTISEIAAAYSVTVQAIVEANRLANPNQIRAGQKLFIPE